MHNTQPLLGSLSGNKIRASTPPACHLVRSGRNPDVRHLSGRLPKCDGKAENMTFSEEKKSTTNGSPLDPADSLTDRRITRFSEQPYFHEPVMKKEIVDVFSDVPAGTVVDGTLGGGGHSKAILESRPDVQIIGIDQDKEALEAARESLKDYKERVVLVHDRFDNLSSVLDRNGVAQITGALFDLGVSSYQLDNPERGFSFRRKGPLDMRMNLKATQTAHDFINKENEETIAQVLKKYGDERFYRKVAQAIVSARPISDTLKLAEVISEAIPARSRRTKGHPARRSFQAIRIAINQELAVIEPTLIQVIELLQVGGRCGVMSYHSGEDRIVKQVIREHAGLNRQNSRYLPAVEDTSMIRLLKRKGQLASEEEINRNSRASSARLRTFEKIREQRNA